MKSIFWRITLKLKRKSYFSQLAIFSAASFLMTLFVLPLIFLADRILGENSNGPKIDWWIGILIIVPILETYFNQKLPFILLQKWEKTKSKYGIYLLLSAMVFAGMHGYSIQYIIAVFPAGLVLAYVYVFYCRNPRIAFWSTTIIHALKNSVALLALVLEK
jgi:hypothetical protein